MSDSLSSRAPLDSDARIEARATLYKQIATNFVNSFTNGLDADIPTFLAQFSPTVDWYDHAFFLHPVGFKGMERFRTAWLTAIRDFKAEITSIDVIEGGTVIRCVYNGTMVGAMPGRPASGKDFQANSLIMLGIDEDGKIQRVDEYYTATLDECKGLEHYTLMSAGSRPSSKI